MRPKLLLLGIVAAGHSSPASRRRAALAAAARVILADTASVYALIDASDACHGRVIEWWKQTTDAILVPVTVLPEVC